MGKVILVTGGARSGKSSYAESIYNGLHDVTYIATSRVYDDEMKDRVMMHRASRPAEWRTFEENYDLYKAVDNTKNYLLDCLTILTSNIMFDITGETEKITLELQKQVEDTVLTEIKKLIDKVKETNASLVMVTNEIGSSIVPEHHVSRVYRDIIGRINQKVAAMCDEVYFVTCGLPLRLK